MFENVEANLIFKSNAVPNNPIVMTIADNILVAYATGMAKIQIIPM